jgi:2-C-methyl-D-erythritol 2,4-cyclodiphosphate synthase
VALHAVIDALLGAAGLGDVGALFPSGGEAWRDADSGELLERAAQAVREAGWIATSIDLAIVAAEPAIAPRRVEIARRIAELASLGAAQVTVKGTTTDGLGITGGDGIAAHAVAVVRRADPTPRPDA